MLSFIQQAFIDYQEVGILGILNNAQKESDRFLNQTAIDFLTSSIL